MVPVISSHNRNSKVIFKSGRKESTFRCTIQRTQLIASIKESSYPVRDRGQR